MLAFAAITNKDKVGLVLFSDRVEKYIPPAKGRSHVLRLIRELLTFEPEGRGTDLNAPLRLLGSVLKRKATVFLVSDFWAGDFTTSLSVLARRHDCVAVRVRDPRETDLPAVGSGALGRRGIGPAAAGRHLVARAAAAARRARRGARRRAGAAVPVARRRRRRHRCDRLVRRAAAALLPGPRRPPRPRGGRGDAPVRAQWRTRARCAGARLLTAVVAVLAAVAAAHGPRSRRRRRTAPAGRSRYRPTRLSRAADSLPAADRACMCWRTPSPSAGCWPWPGTCRREPGAPAAPPTVAGDQLVLEPEPRAALVAAQGRRPQAAYSPIAAALRLPRRRASGSSRDYRVYRTGPFRLEWRGRGLAGGPGARARRTIPTSLAAIRDPRAWAGSRLRSAVLLAPAASVWPRRPGGGGGAGASPREPALDWPLPGAGLDRRGRWRCGGCWTSAASNGASRASSSTGWPRSCARYRRRPLRRAGRRD